MCTMYVCVYVGVVVAAAAAAAAAEAEEGGSSGSSSSSSRKGGASRAYPRSLLMMSLRKLYQCSKRGLGLGPRKTLPRLLREGGKEGGREGGKEE